MDNKYFDQHGLDIKILLSGFTLMLGLAVFSFYYYFQTQQTPPRAYTVLGTWLGVFAIVLLVVDAFYVWRKRTGQEQVFGTLRAWLWLHVVVSILAVVLAGYHAGWHFDGGTGSSLMLFFTLTLLSGIYGWYVYLRLPKRVNREVGNLASKATQQQLILLADLREKLQLNIPLALSDLDSIIENKGSLRDPSEILDLATLDSAIAQLQLKYRKQKRFKIMLRSWLYVHIPAAVLVFVLIPVHIFDHIFVKDTYDFNLTQSFNTPSHYADPESCAECHQAQYDEWIGSMHGHAVSSPVTELQNRLVVLKERELLASGALSQPVVGDLCVKCHAPTGYLGNTSQHEDILIAAKDREPASRFGISCVTCHQIESVNALPNDNKFPYRNIRNIRIDNTTIMRGQLPNGVSNAAHQNQYMAEMEHPVICASCHTVAVEDPSNQEPVLALQDTYTEWLDGGKNLNWSDSHCMTCHNMPLGAVVAEVQDMQQKRLPLASRINRIKSIVQGNQLASNDTFAADPNKSYDRDIEPEQRRFLHTFTGVDYHLEKEAPFLLGEEKFSQNQAIHADNVKRVDDLLKISSALRIESVSDDFVTVDVANLATGHHLPAGFAFAREMWLELSVSHSSFGSDNWEVIVGGKNGRPLRANERLNKSELGLKNFQAVLFNGNANEETVLQNEATAVLKGKQAVQAGFQDRIKFLVPGEIRTIRIPVPQALNHFERVRVRLRFRNYPIEFITQLAERFDSLGDNSRASRSRNLIAGLKIFEMAEDEVRAN